MGVTWTADGGFPMILEGNELMRVWVGKFVHSGTYTNGTGISVASSDFGFSSRIDSLIVTPGSGHEVKWDKTNAKLVVYGGQGQIAEDVTVTDDDSAATTGVAVQIHTKGGRTAWFEFVSPPEGEGTGA